MSVNIRYPNISGFPDKEQLAQIKSYLHQLVEQLNYALTTLGSGDGTGQSTDTYDAQGGDISYYELKSLIIQELQEVENLFKKLSNDIDSKYVSVDEVDTIAAQTMEKISFTIDKDGNLWCEFTPDEDGNLYYEVEE